MSFGWYDTKIPRIQETYSDNKKNGKCVKWYENGDLWMEEYYDNDVLIDSRRYERKKKGIIARLSDKLKGVKS
jgi:antitoxin component YwqK of YwqJK toxin-antitoxin module